MINSKSARLVLLFFLLIVSQNAKRVPAQNRPPSENKLAALAASMKPGTFELLNAEGDESGYGKSVLSNGGSNGITGFAGKMVYDAATDRVYFSGGEHGGITKTIYYDIARNKWIDLGRITAGIYGHAYDSNAIIPGSHELFANSKLEVSLRRLDLKTSVWSLPAQPSVKFYGTEPSVEYFPERDELLWLQGGWGGGLAAYKRSTDSWKVVSRNLPALQLRGAIARYIPAQHAVLLMGGVNTDPAYPKPDVQGRAVYKYDQNGVITRLKDFPSSIWMYINHYLAVVDPPSSELIVINSVLNGSWVYESGNPNPFTNKNEIWKYNLPTDTWTQMDISILPDPTEWWQPTDTSNGGSGAWPAHATATSIPKYGVTMFTSEAWEWKGRQSRVYIYKHSAGAPSSTGSAASLLSSPQTASNQSAPKPSSSPGLTFADKCAQGGVLGCYGFDSAANVRDFPSGKYPLKYGGWDGAGPCASAGLSEHAYTKNRRPDELNAVAKAQSGVCYYPIIDQATFSSGSGSLRIEVPSKSDQNAGGFFDTTFQGLDKPHLRVGPDNGGEIWHQFRYRTHSMASNSFNGAFPRSFTKAIIFGGVPPGLDWFGSDRNLMSVFAFATGWNGGRNGLFQSYTYMSSESLQPAERNIGGTIYLQTGVKCPYNDAGPYSYPPCVRLEDDKWYEITRRLKLQPVASDFVVSNTTLSRQRSFNAAMVGRYVYIAGDGFYRISGFINSDSVRLNASAAAGAKKTVYISDYPNSILQEWVDGVLIINNSDQRMSWDLANAGWGQFRLQPHMTAKNPGITHTPGTVWYDDMIISTQPIPMVK